MGEGPRIAPGTRSELGLVNTAITRGLALATGGRPLNLFTTLGRHRGLFRAWLPFAGALMPRGKLRRADSEVVILRVAHNCGCEYEWRHHEHIARTAGLSSAQVEAVRGGGELSARHRLLIEAVDELHCDRDLTDGLWERLRTELSDTELIELCVLVGHYEMLAMTLNALRVEPDPVSAAPPRALRVLTRGAR